MLVIMDIVVDMRYVYIAIVYGGLAIIFSIVSAILFMSKRIGLWGIFEKAGEKEWKSIIPVYSQITLLKICKLKPWLVVLYLDFIIPIIGFLALRDVRWISIIVMVGFVIYRFMIAIRLGQLFKKGDVFSFLLAFFPSILLPVLGCTKSEKYTNVVEEKKK